MRASHTTPTTLQAIPRWSVSPPAHFLHGAGRRGEGTGLHDHDPRQTLAVKRLDRLNRLIEMDAPDIVIRNEWRLVKCALSMTAGKSAPRRAAPAQVDISSPVN